MPILDKLFQQNRERKKWGICSKKVQHFESPEKLTSHKWWKSPDFDPQQIRLIVFKENDQGKKLVFDSKGVRKRSVTKKDASLSTPVSGLSRITGRFHQSPASESMTSGASFGEDYEFVRYCPDVKMLGEMLFGSIAMSYKGTMAKVHTMKSPPQLMLSQVFQLKPPKEMDDKDTISILSGDGSLHTPIHKLYYNESESIAHSMPVAIPATSPYDTKDDDLSDFSASGSFLNPIPSPGSLSSGTTTPNNSFHRRWLRNQVTSMEYASRKKSIENNGLDEPAVSRKRQAKLGVSVIISLPEDRPLSAQQFQTFFFSHFTLFERHFYRLAKELEKVMYHRRRTILTSCMETLNDFQESINSLYLTPRIKHPIWLNMMTCPSQRNHLCDHLIKELVCELDLHNNKQNNFFVARLLTAVLTHHLAWVPTVMPAGATPSRAFLDKHSSKTLDLLAKSHPYNPLWAQLGDLYGAIGYPTKIARTIIVGKRAETVCRLLYILSYFIRCSEVHEFSTSCDDVHVLFDAEGNAFNWDFSADTTTGEKLDFETSLDCSDTSRRTDSGYADIDLDNDVNTVCTSEDKPVSTSGDVSCGESPESSPVKKADSDKADQYSENCYGHNADFVSSRGSSTKLFPEEFSQNRETGPVCESQSLCPSTTGVSDDSAPSTICEEKQSQQLPDQRNKFLRRKNLADISNLNRSTGEKSEMIVKNCENCLVAENCREILQNNNTEEKSLHHSEAVDTNENGIRIEKEIIICKTSDVQYESKVEVDVTLVKSSVNIQESCINLQDVIKIKENHFICDDNCEKKFLDLSAKSLPDRTRDVIGGFENKENAALTQSDCQCASSSCANKSQLNSTSWDFMKYVSSKLSFKGVENPKGRHSSGHRKLLRGFSSISDVSVTSSTLSFFSDTASTVLDQDILPLALLEPPSVAIKEDDYFGNFGRSLLGGYYTNYVPDLALHGTPTVNNSKIVEDLSLSAQHSVLDEPTAEAVCIVADTDNWTVSLLSSERPQQLTPEKPLGQEVLTSEIVMGLLESVQQFHHMKLASDFCLMHLEDRLQEIYFNSTLLSAYLEQNPAAKTKELAVNLGFPISDFPLLLAVTSVHSPHVIVNILKESYAQLRSSPSNSSVSSMGR